ncbi:MAG: hypothetical protein Q9218_004607 [Villophora microphyllina]
MERPVGACFLKLSPELRMEIYLWTREMDEADTIKYTIDGSVTLANIAQVCRLLRAEALLLLHRRTLAPIHITGQLVFFWGKMLQCKELIRFTPPQSMSMIRTWVVTIDENWMYDDDPETQASLPYLHGRRPGARRYNASVSTLMATYDRSDRRRQVRESTTIKCLQWVLQKIQQLTTNTHVDVIIRMQPSKACEVEQCHPLPFRHLTPAAELRPVPSLSLHPELPERLRGLNPPFSKLRIVHSLEGHSHPLNNIPVIETGTGLFGPWERQEGETEQEEADSLFEYFENTMGVVNFQEIFSTLTQKQWEDLFTVAKPFFQKSSKLRNFIYKA